MYTSLEVKAPDTRKKERSVEVMETRRSEVGGTLDRETSGIEVISVNYEEEVVVEVYLFGEYVVTVFPDGSLRP